MSDAEREPPEGLEKQIVLAAFECIADRGVDGLRLEYVADEAAVSIATLEQIFPSKTALISAVLEDITRGFWGSMADSGSAPERLRFHLRALTEIVRQRPIVFVVLADLELRGRRDPLVGAAIQRDERGWRDALSGIFEQGVSESAWPAGVQPEGATEMVIATVKGTRIAPESAPRVLEQLEMMLTFPGVEPDQS